MTKEEFHESIKQKLCTLYDGTDNMFEREAHQVKIIFHQESKNFEKYIEQNQDKIIYIQLNLEDFKNIARLKNIKEFDNWVLQIPIDMILTKDRKVDTIRLNAVKECCNKYMFTDYVGNWEILQFILTLNPAEVYITNILGFCLEQVKLVCDRAGAGIRLIPNLAQSAWQDSPDITKFFIRPEDMGIYMQFVSGFDFVGPNNVQEVCYQAYSRGYWYGDLNEIITGLNDSIDSRRLPNEFGTYRANCKKRCITGSGCHLCKTMATFSKELEKINIGIKPPIKQL